MKSVFYLEHAFTDGDYDIVTFIGVYSTMRNAKKMINSLKKHPKFKEHKDCFIIDECIINKDEWQEGFVSF